MSKPVVTVQVSEEDVDKHKQWLMGVYPLHTITAQKRIDDRYDITVWQPKQKEVS